MDRLLRRDEHALRKTVGRKKFARPIHDHRGSVYPAEDGAVRRDLDLGYQSPEQYRRGVSAAAFSARRIQLVVP